jgi:cbb3-type cytochrome c oxidase subunit III
MIAETNVAGIALIAAGAALVVLVIAVGTLRRRARGTRAEVPGTMRPGPSDQALETPLLFKLQGWGVVLVTFFVLWFPIMWLIEPSTNLKQEEALRTDSIARGQLATQPFSEENQFGVGCVRCHGNTLTGGVINTVDDQGNPALAYPPNLTTICDHTQHAAIYSVDDIFQVIAEGRGAMPSWSIRFAGALTDQQINDLVLYLVDMSSKNIPFENNVCLNPDASKKALEEPGAAAAARQP